MRAVDTNIVVRFLVADDARQAKKARTAIESGSIFIATAVLLETEWVLRGAYGFNADSVAQAMRALAGLPGVSVEEPAHLAQALEWLGEGMDFADALHLAAAESCSAFLTFDKQLIKAAARRSTVPVTAP